MSSVIDDLRSTRSMDITIENILDGRLLPTLPSFQQEQFAEPQSSTVPFPQEVPSAPLDRVFVEDPQERQQQLSARKMDLVEEARSRFLRRHEALNNTPLN